MPDHAFPANTNLAWTSFESIERAGRTARAERIARGEIMTYVTEEWAVREFPGGHVERLAPLPAFRNEDFPYPA